MEDIQKVHESPAKIVKFKSIASHSIDVDWNSAFRQPRIETALKRKPIFFNARVFILRLNVECIETHLRNDIVKSALRQPRIQSAIFLNTFQYFSIRRFLQGLNTAYQNYNFLQTSNSVRLLKKVTYSSQQLRNVQSDIIVANTYK